MLQDIPIFFLHAFLSCLDMESQAAGRSPHTGGETAEAAVAKRTMRVWNFILNDRTGKQERERQKR